MKYLMKIEIFIFPSLDPPHYQLKRLHYVRLSSIGKVSAQIRLGQPRYSPYRISLQQGLGINKILYLSLVVLSIFFLCGGLKMILMGNCHALIYWLTVSKLYTWHVNLWSLLILTMVYIAYMTLNSTGHSWHNI